eukprot:3808263-Pleurochrysis_carterae.AAC.1
MPALQAMVLGRCTAMSASSSMFDASVHGREEHDFFRVCSENALEAADVAKLAEALRENKHLQTLDLSGLRKELRRSCILFCAGWQLLVHSCRLLVSHRGPSIIPSLTGPLLDEAAEATFG